MIISIPTRQEQKPYVQLKSTEDVLQLPNVRVKGLESPTVVGAQAANELLNIAGVKASFVLTHL